MICLIALIVFGFLSIFSVKYRTLAKEAFDCVFKRLTLRKCESRLDRRIKNKISRKLVKYPKLARFVYKHFEGISWIFTILLIVSLVYSVNGIYNYVVFGNCIGEASNEFCVFTAIEGCGSQTCTGGCICSFGTNCTEKCTEGCNCTGCE